MEYKEQTNLGVFLGGDDTIAKDWILVKENSIQLLKARLSFLREYSLLVGYSL